MREVVSRSELMFAYIKPEGITEMYSAPPAREYYEPIEDEV